MFNKYIGPPMTLDNAAAARVQTVIAGPRDADPRHLSTGSPSIRTQTEHGDHHRGS
jgi:hypothetical protein